LPSLARTGLHNPDNPAKIQAGGCRAPATFYQPVNRLRLFPHPQTRSHAGWTTRSTPAHRSLLRSYTQQRWRQGEQGDSGSGRWSTGALEGLRRLLHRLQETPCPFYHRSNPRRHAGRNEALNHPPQGASQFPVAGHGARARLFGKGGDEAAVAWVRYRCPTR